MQLCKILQTLGIATMLLQTALSEYILDYAPDLTHSKMVYPPLTNEDGSNVTVENWRGTKLFGFDGCGGPQQTAIIQAYKDMNKLAYAEGAGFNVDWNSQWAKDFFGAANGPNRIPDDRREQIQRIFQSRFDWSDPTFPWLSLWVWVRCSGFDNSGDPDNVCRDKKPNDGQCGAPPNNAPMDGADNRMQAYSEPLGASYYGAKYTRVTFCERFFELDPLQDIIDQSKNDGWSDVEKKTLGSYNNQARVFFHEATHWNYFMDAPSKVPYIDDLSMKIYFDSRLIDVEAYEPAYCKMLRNYNPPRKAGFYTQRNADSYAWFALSNYLNKEIGFYPHLPRTSTKPSRPPRDGDGSPLFADSEEDDTFPQRDAVAEVDDPGFVRRPIPEVGCPGKLGGLGATFGLQKDPTPRPPTCDLNEPSNVPATIFTNAFYEPMCTFLEASAGNDNPYLSEMWRIVNATNERKPFPPNTFAARPPASRIVRKRAPPANSNVSSNTRFVMKWTPNEVINGTYIENVCAIGLNCTQAYAQLVQTCGVAGNDHGNLAARSSIDVGCGTYSLDVVEI